MLVVGSIEISYVAGRVGQSSPRHWLRNGGWIWQVEEKAGIGKLCELTRLDPGEINGKSLHDWF